MHMRSMMAYSNLLIVAFVCFFQSVNGIQPWSLQSNSFQSSSRMVDLQLCVTWPWQKPPGRSILQIDVIKCQPDEICTPLPDTQIYGLGFG